MKQNQLARWTAFAEIISAVAIVISLLYVAYEFRRSETLSSKEVNALLFERVQELNSMLIQSPDLAGIVIQAETDSDSLTPDSRLRYLAYQHVFFDSWELAWLYRDDGILDDTTWQEWDSWFIEEARHRPVFGWVENRRQFTGESFRQHVDASLDADNSGSFSTNWK